MRLPTAPQAAIATAGLAFVGASATFNVLHALHKPLSAPEVATWAVVAVAVSCAAAILPGVSIEAARRGALASAAICGFMGLTAVSYSTLNALASAQTARATVGLTAGDAQGVRAAAGATIDAKGRELASIDPTRPAGELDAEIGRLMASRRDLDGCTSYRKAEDARGVCDQVATLRAEKARGERRATLEADIAAARTTIAAQPIKAAVGNADASAIVGYAEAVGLPTTTTTVERLIVLVQVLVVELGGAACFAAAGVLGRRPPVVAAAPAPARPVVAAAPAPARPAKPSATPVPVDAEPDTAPPIAPRKRGSAKRRRGSTNVIPFDPAAAEWVADHVRRRTGNGTPAADIYAAYAASCVTRGVTPIRPGDLGKVMTAAGHSRYTSRGVVQYRGVALVAAPAAVAVA